jgi:hypothetical protein
MSKAGSSLLRTTMVRAADTARKHDPQLARLYYVQMVERGKDHLGTLCVVAANLAERAWAVMHRGACPTSCATPTARRSAPSEPRSSSLSTGRCLSGYEPAGAARRAGKAPDQKVLAGQSTPRARGAGGTRGDLAHPAPSPAAHRGVKQLVTAGHLTTSPPQGNQFNKTWDDAGQPPLA